MSLPTKGQGMPSGIRYHYVSLITCNRWLVPKKTLISYFEHQRTLDQVGGSLR